MFYFCKGATALYIINWIVFNLTGQGKSVASCLFANVFLENMFYNTESSAIAIYLLMKITHTVVKLEKIVFILSFW